MRLFVIFAMQHRREWDRKKTVHSPASGERMKNGQQPGMQCIHWPPGRRPGQQCAAAFADANSNFHYLMHLYNEPVMSYVCECAINSPFSTAAQLPIHVLRLAKLLSLLSSTTSQMSDHRFDCNCIDYSPVARCTCRFSLENAKCIWLKLLNGIGQQLAITNSILSLSLSQRPSQRTKSNI